jgi:prepilin-type N-terminal cleavage/methylation domain-containing protein
MRQRQAGFTLIELMISLVLFSFVIAGVLAVAVSMSQGYREQRASVAAEGAVRVPLDFLADAVRQSSPGSGSGAIWDPNTCTQWAVDATNNIGTGSSAGTDRLDVIYASGAVLTSARATFVDGQSTLDVNDVSQLAAGDSIVISDTSSGYLARIQSIAGNTLTFVTFNTCGSPNPAWRTQTYPIGSLIIRAQHAWFYIDWIDGSPMLMMDPDASASTTNAWDLLPEPLAEGVEDLQLVKVVDVVGTGATIPAEGTPTKATDYYYGNSSSDVAWPAAGTGVLRAIRITMVSRTLSGLVGNLQSYNRPAVEDHAAAALNSDNYRRRVLHTLVELRNLSMSP